MSKKRLTKGQYDLLMEKTTLDETIKIMFGIMNNLDNENGRWSEVIKLWDKYFPEKKTKKVKSNE